MNKKRKLWELNRVNEEEFKAQEKNPVIIILDDIRSLNNIGSFFRTADAFNISKIYLCGITACPPHKDIHKTALGSTETIEWEFRENIDELCSELKLSDYTLCTIEQTEQTVLLQNINNLKGDRFALVFGNEVNGVKQEIVDRSNYVIEIPQFGTKHSLNVSVCAGIVLWEFCKKYIK
jgi:23S rRNA (guanosine2251-2'-O)-methyltransferase